MPKPRQNKKLAKLAAKNYTVLTDEELRSLAFDMVAGVVFTDRILEEREGDHALEMLKMVFLPLTFADQAYAEFFLNLPVGMVYQHISEAGQMGINGYPIFLSCKLLSQDDCDRLKPFYEAAFIARNGAPDQREGDSGGALPAGNADERQSGKNDGANDNQRSVARSAASLRNADEGYATSRPVAPSADASPAAKLSRHKKAAKRGDRQQDKS